MAPAFRHAVGKQTLSGYILVRPKDAGFFGEDPGEQGREIVLVFGEGESVRARYYRAGKSESRLKIAYTGKAGAALRRFLRKRFKSRRARRPKGYLLFTRLGADRFGVNVESLKNAVLEVLQLESGRYFEGARARSVLHPALIDIRDLLGRVQVSSRMTAGQLQGLIVRSFSAGGWKETPSVGGGLALPAGMRRSQAQLHIVVGAEDLVPALVSLAAAFHLGDIDLGVVLVPDRSLSRRLGRSDGRSMASLDRAVQVLRTLPFLLKGPCSLYALSMTRTLR